MKIKIGAFFVITMILGFQNILSDIEDLEITWPIRLIDCDLSAFKRARSAYQKSKRAILRQQKIVEDAKTIFNATTRELEKEKKAYNDSIYLADGAKDRLKEVEGKKGAIDNKVWTKEMARVERNVSLMEEATQNYVRKHLAPAQKRYDKAKLMFDEARARLSAIKKETERAEQEGRDKKQEWNECMRKQEIRMRGQGIRPKVFDQGTKLKEAEKQIEETERLLKRTERTRKSRRKQFGPTIDPKAAESLAKRIGELKKGI